MSRLASRERFEQTGKQGVRGGGGQPNPKPQEFGHGSSDGRDIAQRREGRVVKLRISAEPLTEKPTKPLEEVPDRNACSV